MSRFFMVHYVEMTVCVGRTFLATITSWPMVHLQPAGTVVLAGPVTLLICSLHWNLQCTSRNVPLPVSHQWR